MAAVLAPGRRALRWAFDLVLPPRCLACGVVTAVPDGLCPACWVRLPLIERPFCERLGTPFPYDHGEGLLSPEAIAHPPRWRRARAAARYDGVARDLVHRLKFGDRVETAVLLARLMASAGAELLKEAQVIVPVPLYRTRLWSRRFNQSALIAREIGRRAGIPIETAALVRKKRTRPQVGLTRSERADNLAGAFAIDERHKAAIAGRSILLVDDVMTTGATADAAVRTLQRAGATAVDVLTFARVVAAT